MSEFPPVAIIAAGACTSLGLDAESSMAAVEAKMSRMVNLEPFGPDAPVPVAALEAFDEDVARGRRVHWMTSAAYLDLARRFPKWQRVDLPLIMVGPEPEADHDIEHGFLISSLRELSDTMIPRPVGEFWLPGGRGGWFAGLRRAIELLRGGEALVALGAVGCDCDANSLIRLRRRNALHSDDNPDGRIPGEAAVFLLLARTDVPRQIDARPWAWIRDCRLSHEPRHAFQPESTLGEGLTRLYRALREDNEGWRADRIYSAQPSGGHWARAFEMAYLRNVELMPEPLRIRSVCDELGDCGAATPALLTAFAGLRFSRGDAVERVLVHGESDDGGMGGCLLDAGQPDEAGARVVARREALQ